MTIEVSALTPTQAVLKLAAKNQDDLQTISKQISSGEKYDDFKGFAKDATTEQFLSLNSTLTSISAYQTSNNSAIASAKVTDSAISQLQDYATSLSTLITQRRNSASGTNVQLTLQAQGILSKIQGSLNTQFNGRYVFAGSKTTTEPVSDLSVSNLNDTDEPTASYYNGDGSVPIIRSSDSENTQYGVLGNDKAFQDLIGAANLAIKGDTNNDDATLSKAVDMINNAVSELASTRANVDIGISNMTQANATHQATQLIMQGNLDTISQTDIVQATSQMSELQAIIQAGYLAFSRLSSLHLTSYLQ